MRALGKAFANSAFMEHQRDGHHVRDPTTLNLNLALTLALTCSATTVARAKIDQDAGG